MVVNQQDNMLNLDALETQRYRLLHLNQIAEIVTLLCCLPSHLTVQDRLPYGLAPA